VADLFDEVEEQLRSDRYRTLASRVLPWVIAALVAALIAALAYWGWDSYRRQTVSRAADEYSAALEAFSKGEEAQAVKLWNDVSQSPSAGYKSLALMQLGGLRMAANDTDGAVKLWDQAADAGSDPIIADAARLKSAFALLDTKPYTEVEARLKPLMEEGRPYRVQAREALAFAKLMAGNTAGARSDFTIISSTLDAPEGARARAKAAMQLIDSGSAKSVPAAVKAELALPPPVPVTPGAADTTAPSDPPQQQAPGSQ
jgi:hypothetical protein